MRNRQFMWVALALAASAARAEEGQPGRAGAPLGGAARPKPLPQKIVTAWKQAGAKVGWMRAEKYSYHDPFLSFEGYFLFVPEKEGKPGDLPAFSLGGWEPGRLAKLPVPATAFGLDLRFVSVTDAGLKELAGLSGLQTLDLTFTKVTDVGLKELRELKSLQELDLGHTEVTDAGLKELRELKGLQTLYLGDTQVTDVGLKELAGLTSLQTLHLGRTRLTDSGPKVTDAGLKTFAGLKNLQWLSLERTFVMDAGLK